MADKPRIFSVQEANALLPRLNLLMERQARRLRELENAVAQLRRSHGPIAPDLSPHPDDAGELVELKTRLRDSVRMFREGWQEVEAFGAAVQDMRTGLIDFPGEHEGRSVWLCWRYGEPAVAFWHPMDRGFDARRPLENVLIPRTLN